MSIELSIRDLKIIVTADEIGFTNFLRSLNIKTEKLEDGVISFQARCFDSNFTYNMQRRFLQGYPSHLIMSRNTENYKSSELMSCSGNHKYY